MFWGVGTKLITAFDQPALGAVYKMVSIENDHHQMVDTIKLSNNAEKVSTPGQKQVWRITKRADGKSEGDYVTLYDEDPRNEESIYMFHPSYTYINKTVSDFDARPLLVPIYDRGQQVYTLPTLDEIKEYSFESLDALWDEYKRDLNPQDYPVDLSQKLYDHKMNIINTVRDHVNHKDEEEAY